MKSIGNNLKKVNNLTMNPYSYYPQYGFGSWMKENAGTIGSVVGAGAALGLTALTGGAAAPLIPAIMGAGATLGGSIGGAVQQNNANQLSAEEQAKQVGIQTALSNAQNMSLPRYGTLFKNGGNMMKPIVINSLACGGKMKAMGGKLESSDKLDGISIYGGDITHESSPIGGIPIGKKGLVESSEVRVGNYVFSNRF